MRPLTLLVSLLCAALALSAPAVAAPAGHDKHAKKHSKPAPEPELSVLVSSPIQVSGEQGSDTTKTYLSLLNSGKKPVTISISFQATSSDRVAVKSWNPEVIPAGEAKRVEVVLSGLTDLGEAATGQLVVSGGASPVAQSIEVDPPAPDTFAALVVLIGSFVAAIAFAVILRAMTEKEALERRAPGPKWTFGSWATTLTGAGAVFGTVLGQATFPSFPEVISKTELTNLSIFFGIVVLVGPFLFEATREKEPPGADEEGCIGTNRTLLLSCSFTLWAVLGQLGAFGLLGWELLGHHAAAILAVLATVAVAGLAMRYFLLTLKEMLAKNWGEEARKAKREAAAGKSLPTPASAWTLL